MLNFTLFSSGKVNTWINHQLFIDLAAAKSKVSQSLSEHKQSNDAVHMKTLCCRFGLYLKETYVRN